MLLYYDVTPQEEIVIDRCCAWLDEEMIEMTYLTAEEQADQITEPEAAQELLLKTLIEIIVRNRREARRA